jgi:hypothetical protein
LGSAEPRCSLAWCCFNHGAPTLLAETATHVRARCGARGRSVYYGVPGRGKSFTNKGAVVYRFENQKIASVDLYFDDLRIVTEQLGATLVPPPS